MDSGASLPETCPLTSREREVVGLLAEGLTYGQIAQRVHLSTSTVRTHLHNTYAKLGVVDRAHAVLVCERAGWLHELAELPSNVDEEARAVMLALALALRDGHERDLPRPHLVFLTALDELFSACGIRAGRRRLLEASCARMAGAR